jgi:DNA-binding NtrC family response regulator
MPLVLVIDDDRTVVLMLKRALEALNVTVESAATANEGIERASQLKPDVVLLDIMLPGISGLELFHTLQSQDRRLPIIFMTSGAGSETAIEAMRLGAYDYIAKPLDLGAVLPLVAQALETRRLMHVPVALEVPDEPENQDVFVGRSPKMLEVFKAIGRVAGQNVTVLIRGESGSGKELVARALYQFSDRRDRPFMAVNCAALPETLLESELFGHEKGSFTGADRRRIGKFEQCNGGTLFLDEVGDMAPLVQGKVLRALQEQRFERVGGNETIQTDVRLIAATNRPLEHMVEKGEFRADLLYRLNGVTIALPPLRERTQDIPELLRHWLSRFRCELQKGEIEGLAPEALTLLEQYHWPGNVRELQSVVRQMVLNASGPVIVPEFLPDELRGGARTATSPASHSSASGPSADLQQFIDVRIAAHSTNLYAEAVEMMERYLFAKVLSLTEGNQSRAAEILGITRGKVRDRIAAFEIAVDRQVTIGESPLAVTDAG